MQKLKKYAKKYFKKALITALVCVFLCISFVFPCFAYVGNEEVTLLTNFFESCDGDFERVDNGNVVGLNYSYFRTKLFSGSGVHLKGHLYMPLYSEEFDPTKYYTFVIPLSFPTGAVNPGYNMLSFITPSGVEISNTSRVVSYPDPNGNYYEREFSTVIYTFHIKGTDISEGCSFFLSVFPSSSSSNRLNFGLLENRSITISTMTEQDYLSLYGSGDYDIDTGDIIARVDAIENELFDKADLGSISESVFGSLTWFADISPGIMSAGMIVDELLNFGGINNTWMMNVVRFALLLGCTALILAIGPGVISKFSSSERKEGYNRRRKGDD